MTGLVLNEVYWGKRRVHGKGDRVRERRGTEDRKREGRGRGNALTSGLICLAPGSVARLLLGGARGIANQ